MPEVSYTPRGKRIVMFPMWVEEGEFSIQVVGSGDPFPTTLEATVGGNVLVAGELVKTKLKTHDILKVKASKILWMEE